MNAISFLIMKDNDQLVHITDILGLKFHLLTLHKCSHFEFFAALG